MPHNHSTLLDLSAHHRRRDFFAAFSKSASTAVGHPATFILACMVILTWVISGPFFGYSNTWQLMINTTTTILTFLTVFLIQNTQNRDGTALQIKLNELIRSDKEAHNAIINLEELTEHELVQMRNKYEHLALLAREALRKGQNDKGRPELPL